MSASSGSYEEESESPEESSKLHVEEKEAEQQSKSPVEEQSDSSGEEEEESKSPVKEQSDSSGEEEEEEEDSPESLKERAPIPETSKSVPTKQSLEMTLELSKQSPVEEEEEKEESESPVGEQSDSSGEEEESKSPVKEQSDSSGEEEEEEEDSPESLKERAPIPETSKSVPTKQSLEMALELSKQSPVEEEEEEEEESESDSAEEHSPAPRAETSTLVPAKRSLKIVHELSNKKMKTSSPKQNHFSRIFTQKDDLVLLQGAIDFCATTPFTFKNIDEFIESVKDFLSFRPTSDQIRRKIRKLREKFFRAPKNQDPRHLELSRQLWGVDGLLSKSKVKPKSKNDEEANVGTTSLSSSSRDVVSFLNGYSGTSFGLGESTLLDCWENVEDGETKRELEQRVKDLKVEQAKLAWKGFELVADIGKVMCRHHASSSGK